jgi:transcriptional regulator with XRE-family HTH domain
MNYGRAVRIARAIAGLEQRDLARLANLDSSHISLIERGKRNPTVATLEKIAKALEIPYHLLTLLAAETGDLKNVGAAETKQLGEHLARVLLTNKYDNSTGRKTRRSDGRTKS